ncbi:hypothetical protein J2Y45_003509 [Dyadobacter sp. BE34]|uniref:Uncharacterized protein n=1 Tax=Dyadobacter fermentans TaxID=94254 RepID=A0ABU1QYT9_9BACT|nr:MULTISPECIES: hypothetical protein [Dyadobacter]MDR6806317.1 hypothetical protein [Dyadobacter fermentans]MDR7044058.1 hypothetical protein [Dyadobacter sp. BE242]MDR7198369.1 hypothetical protein [Dyadobacter sp. BE34]MDR7216331.1 hypothetical protein [Dyadobacter sp. BE31]MDR7264142.1 hypothetical protein [Dyadobacter sp. BE32]
MSYTKPYFAGFEYHSKEVCKFLQAYSTFTLMLTNGAIIHHQPEHALDFRRWLAHHQIEDIRVSIRNNDPAAVAQQ